MTKYRLQIWEGDEVVIDDKSYGTVWEAENKGRSYFAQSPAATRWEITERDSGKPMNSATKEAGTLGNEKPRQFGAQR